MPPRTQFFSTTNHEDTSGPSLDPREIEQLAEKLFVAHDRHLDVPAIPLDEIAEGCFHEAEVFLQARAEWRVQHPTDWRQHP